MGRPLQIRDVPDEVLERLRSRADAEHLSLAAYTLRILEREARTVSVSEALSRRRGRARATRGEIVRMVRADRDRR